MDKLAGRILLLPPGTSHSKQVPWWVPHHTPKSLIRALTSRLALQANRWTVR